MHRPAGRIRTSVEQLDPVHSHGEMRRPSRHLPNEPDTAARQQFVRGRLDAPAADRGAFGQHGIDTLVVGKSIYILQFLRKKNREKRATDRHSYDLCQL